MKPFYAFFLLAISYSTSFYTTANSSKTIDLYSMSLEELMTVQVVSAATGYDYSLKSAPASVTIIEAKEWQAKGSQTLTQALRGVVGLQNGILTSSNNERQPVLRGLAGAFGQQIKVLIDGIAINRIHHGGSPAVEIPLIGFKRIEIIRSPGSAIYGADAFAGIINLVSDDNPEQQTQLIVNSGKFDAYNLGYLGANKWRDIQWNYAVNYQHYGDDPNRIIHADLQSGLDLAFNTQASLAPGNFDGSYQQTSINLQASFGSSSISYYGIIGSFGFGAGVVEALDPGTGHHHSHIVDLKHKFELLGVKDTTINAWYQDKHSQYPFTIFPSGAVLPIGADGNLNFTAPTSVAEFTDGYIGYPSNKSQLAQISISQIFPVKDKHQIRWQLGFEHHYHKPGEQKNFGPGVLTGMETLVDGQLTDVTNSQYAYLPFKSRHFYFLSLQDNWQVTDNLALHLGGRYDHYSDFGSTTNPRTGLVWSASDKMIIKAFYATAFRAPSFFDLYGANNPVNLGNSELKPEEITTNEISILYDLNKNLHSEFTYYHYDAEQLIEYILNEEAAGSVAANVGTITGQGFEWQLRWRPVDNLDILANYSKVKSEDTNGNPRPNFSDAMAALSFNYKWNEQININVFNQYYGKQDRVITDSRPPLDSYLWHSVKVSYQPRQKPVELSITFNNASDVSGYMPSLRIKDDHPIPGRQWLLELKYFM